VPPFDVVVAPAPERQVHGEMKAFEMVLDRSV